MKCPIARLLPFPAANADRSCPCRRPAAAQSHPLVKYLKLQLALWALVAWATACLGSSVGIPRRGLAVGPTVRYFMGDSTGDFRGDEAQNSRNSEEHEEKTGYSVKPTTPISGNITQHGRRAPGEKKEDGRRMEKEKNNRSLLVFFGASCPLFISSFDLKSAKSESKKIRRNAHRHAHHISRNAPCFDPLFIMLSIHPLIRFSLAFFSQLACAFASLVLSSCIPLVLLLF